MSHQAGTSSAILTVDKSKRLIIPEVRARRVTLILRDVDSSTTMMDLLTLLSTHPKLLSISLPSDKDSLIDVDFKSISPDISSLSMVGRSWFLTLKDEELTLDVAWWLRNQTLGVRPKLITFPFAMFITFPLPKLMFFTGFLHIQTL